MDRNIFLGEKIPVLPKVICRFSAVTTKALRVFLVEFDEIIRAFLKIWIEKNEKHNSTRYKRLPQIYSYLNMALAQEETNRSKHRIEPRKKDEKSNWIYDKYSIYNQREEDRLR